MQIGAHTATHPVLPSHPASAQLWDLVTNKNALESVVGAPVTSFAYPYGAHTDETVSLVRKAGFARACTTEAMGVVPGGDPLRVPRVAVGDWTGEELSRRLREWVSSA